MSAAQTLQDLYSLGASSSGISRLIYGLIRHDEEEQYLSGLRGSELARLVDFLDEVRTLPPPFRLLRNKLCRPLAPLSPPTIFPDNVYANCKPSAVITQPSHPHIPYPAISPKSVTNQSPLAALPMYG